MQLVLEHQVSDGFTYSCTSTLPIEYESAEALAVDFEAAVRLAYRNENWDLTFAGHLFNIMSFFDRVEGNLHYQAPHIWTIDEWFKYYAK